MGEKKMESKMGKKIKVKLVKAYHTNLIFYIPTSVGTKRFKIRQVNGIKYLQNLVEFIGNNGKQYSKLINSIYDRKTYLDDVYEIELTKTELLSLLDTPGRKAPKYEMLMQLLS